MTAARTLYIEGCPCEMVEERVEGGVLHEHDSRTSWSGAYSLLVAPDGVLFISCLDWVSSLTPSRDRTIRRLRQMAKELAK